MYADSLALRVIMEQGASSIDGLPELCTPHEVAKIFRCSSRYVTSQCRAGRLEASLVAGRYLIPRRAVKDFLRRTATCLDQTAVQASRGEPNVVPGSSFGTIKGEDASAA